MPATTTFVNQETLLNYARGIMQDFSTSLANFVAPVCPTGVASAQYKEFSDKNAFAVPKTKRGIGGDANRISFESEDKFFNCAPNALEAVVDEHERRLAGTNLLNLEQAKIATIISQAKLAREIEVFDMVRKAVPAETGVGN